MFACMAWFCCSRTDHRNIHRLEQWSSGAAPDWISGERRVRAGHSMVGQREFSGAEQNNTRLFWWRALSFASQFARGFLNWRAHKLTCQDSHISTEESLERRFESVFGCHLDSQESSQRNRNFAYTTFTGVFCCFQKHKRNQCCYFVALVCVGFVFENILALGFSRI